jgi:hypothetical protein
VPTMDGEEHGSKSPDSAGGSLTQLDQRRSCLLRRTTTPMFVTLWKSLESILSEQAFVESTIASRRALAAAQRS